MGLGTGGALLLIAGSIAFFTKTQLKPHSINNQSELTLVAEGNQGEKEGMTMTIRSILTFVTETTKAIGVNVIASVLTARPCNENPG